MLFTILLVYDFQNSLFLQTLIHKKKMTEKELAALASLLDEDDEKILGMIEQQIYMLGTQMIPYLEAEWQNQTNEQTQKRIENIVHHLQYDGVLQDLKYWYEHEQEDLLKGLWIIAKYRYHQCSLEALQEEIENIYTDVWQLFRDDLHPYDQVRMLNSIIFGKHKLRPNRDFQAVDNSMINKVLETRVGNPIALCCVYMLVAKRLNLPIYGVNLPNIFILTYKNDLFQFYINPTNKGVIFQRSDIDNYIEQLKITNSPVYYEPCSHVDILRRVLRNLLYAYEKAEAPQNMKEVKRLLDLLS